MDFQNFQPHFQPKFKILYTGIYRELALYSGRGAGKSHAVAEYLVLAALVRKVRILCTREIQTSIADSVLKLLADKIDFYKLNAYFDVQRTAIYCLATGSEFIFKGIARNIQSIKSMEGVDICWLEEAQTASKESLDILLPTIFRNEGAKVIYTYNPRFANDAVYQRFHTDVIPEKAIVHRVDWRDNVYFSDAMKEEMAFAKKHDPEMAMHILEGELCPSPNDIAVIPLAWLKKCIDVHLALNLPQAFKYVGLDFADGGQDKSAIALREGALLLEAFELDKKDFINQTVAQADSYAKMHEVTRVHFDSIGIGAGAKGDFNRVTDRHYIAQPHIGSAQPFGFDSKFTDNMTNGQFFRNLKAQAWWNIRLKVENTLRLLDGNTTINPLSCFFISGKIPDKQLDKLLMELSQASYKHEDGKLMVDKAPDDQASPNMADAVVMAYIHDARNGLKAR